MYNDGDELTIVYTDSTKTFGFEQRILQTRCPFQSMSQM